MSGKPLKQDKDYLRSRDYMKSLYHSSTDASVSIKVLRVHDGAERDGTIRLKTSNQVPTCVIEVPEDGIDTVPHRQYGCEEYSSLKLLVRSVSIELHKKDTSYSHYKS